MTPIVSVIVPVFNQDRALIACLQALEHQAESPPYEVIVVDNGSVTPMVRMAHGPRAHVSWIHDGHPGSYAARNAGIRAARGEILAFTDADCVPAPDWIARGVAAVLRLPGPGLIGGRVAVTTQTTPTIVEQFDQLYGFQQQAYVQTLAFAMTANLWTTRATFHEVGLFDAGLLSGGDLEWGHRVARRLTVAYAEEVQVRHPARRTIGALARRTVRVAGGIQQLLDRRGHGLRGLGREVIQEVLGGRTWRRAVRDRRLPTWPARVGVASCLWLVQVLTAWERVRVYHGGAPRRA